MRVLIASDGIFGLTSSETVKVFGEAWASRGCEVAAVPVSTGGESLVSALSQLGFSQEIIDLTTGDIPKEIPVDAIAVVSSEQSEVTLTGINGLAANQGRHEGWDIAKVLEQDAIWAQWGLEMWPSNPEGGSIPGSGAHRGQGLRVLAAGGRLVTGVELCAEVANLEQTAQMADLIVSGCEQLEFGSFGGPVIGELIRIADTASRPLILLVGQNHISGRELRAAGIEAVHALQPGGADPEWDLEGFTRLAAQAAITWRW